MKVLALSSLLMLLACLSTVGPPDAAVAVVQEERQSIVVKLDHFTDDLHAAVMAMGLAAGLAKEDADVTLFVNLEGVRAVDSRQPQDLSWGEAGSFAKHYKAFVDAGGRVLVCSHCAKAAGLQSGDLREGASIVSDSKVHEAILAADKLLDY